MIVVVLPSERIKRRSSAAEAVDADQRAVAVASLGRVAFGAEVRVRAADRVRAGRRRDALANVEAVARAAGVRRVGVASDVAAMAEAEASSGAGVTLTFAVAREDRPLVRNAAFVDAYEAGRAGVSGAAWGDAAFLDAGLAAGALVAGFGAGGGVERADALCEVAAEAGGARLGRRARRGTNALDTLLAAGALGCVGALVGRGGALAREALRTRSGRAIGVLIAAWTDAAVGGRSARHALQHAAREAANLVRRAAPIGAVAGVASVVGATRLASAAIARCAAGCSAARRWC